MILTLWFPGARVGAGVDEAVDVDAVGVGEDGAPELAGARVVLHARVVLNPKMGEGENALKTSHAGASRV